MAAMPFAASRKSEPFRGRRLHADARHVDRQHARDGLAHGVAVGADARRLAEKRDVDIRDAPAPRRNARRGILDEDARRSALPLRIARRKMRADVAVADRAEDGVGQRVKRHVGIRMTYEALPCAQS